jgi:hypothetical protein
MPTSSARRFIARNPAERVIRMTAGTFPRSSPRASARCQNHVARAAGTQNTVRARTRVTSRIHHGAMPVPS